MVCACQKFLTAVEEAKLRATTRRAAAVQRLSYGRIPSAWKLNRTKTLKSAATHTYSWREHHHAQHHARPFSSMSVYAKTGLARSSTCIYRHGTNSRNRMYAREGSPNVAHSFTIKGEMRCRLTWRRAWRDPFLLRVIMWSTRLRTAFALTIVVVMRP